MRISDVQKHLVGQHDQKSHRRKLKPKPEPEIDGKTERPKGIGNELLPKRGTKVG